MIKKSKLSVSVHDSEFAKDFQYQITIIYEGTQKSTDVSAIATSPIFINNTLIFDLPSYHTLTGQIIFVANMISNPGNGKSTKKTLGECSLDLTPLGLQPTQTYNLPIRQQLKFTRSKDGNEITVGKFISSIKIVQEQDIPSYLQELQTKKIEKNEYFVDLPDFDSHLDFVWRIRLQVREAFNIPDTDTIKPQVFVETGWTEFRDMLPQNSRIFSSSILNTNNPEWNQTFLITNPSHITSQKGFIMITLKDNHNLDDVFRIYVPVQSMVSFVPYNIKAIKDDHQIIKTQFLFSIMLEKPYNQKDRMHDVLVNDITFDPIVAPFKTFNLVLVSDSQDEPRLNFYPFNVKSDSIQRIFQFDQTEEFSYIMSQNMRISPIKSSKWRAATIFTVSENLLRKPISLYIVGKTELGKYKVGGIVENIQKDLINLLIQKVKKKLFLVVRPHPSIKMGKCQIQLSDKSQEQEISQMNESKVSQISARNRGQQTATQKLMKDLNVSSSEGLFKHVQQNNEIIVRMLRQLDDKSESLRQAAAEISSLRNKVKLLQNQNSILKRNALKQEDELINLVQREVENMSNRDLKEKIGKISHLYKSQKLRSQQLDRALKHLEPQVSNSMKLQSVIANQKNQLQLYEQKILKYKKEFDRIGVYKDTIKKQEKVIMKLESVMKDGMEEVRQARKYKLQLEEMKKRGGSTHMYQSSTHSKTDREQIQRLQRIIAQMQMQQSAKMQGSSYSSSNKGDNKDESLYQLQFKLHQAQTRIKSLEQELQEKSRSYGRQLAMFKMKLVQKQAVLNGYQPY